MNENELFHLYALPMPPSHNQMYRNVPGIGRVSTKEFKAFKTQMLKWAAANEAVLQPERLKCINALGNGYQLHVTTEFYFRHDRIFCKDGSPKRLDVSNRIKAIHDSLAEALSIDDKHFWALYAVKIAVKSTSATQPISEYVNVKVYRQKTMTSWI